MASVGSACAREIGLLLVLSVSLLAQGVNGRDRKCYGRNLDRKFILIEAVEKHFKI